MKKLIRLAFIIVVAVLAYNYFLGTPEEKAGSEKVIQQVKEVGKSIGDLIKKERQNFADGKYDKAFDKIGGLYDKAKDKLGDKKEDRDSFEKLEQKKEELEEEKQKLEEELKKDNPDEDVVKRNESLDDELKSLSDEFGELLKKLMTREEK